MSKLLQFRPLVINPELAVTLGLNEAIMLQQISYWITETESGINKDGRKWIYNTYEQWQEQFPFWSVDTIKRTLKSLKDKDVLIVEQLNKSAHDRTNFYTIRYEHSALVDQGNLPSSIGAESADLTYTTTETTTENNNTSVYELVTNDKPKKHKQEYCEQFEWIWQHKYERDGDNKKAAYKACLARIKSGSTWHDLAEGMNRYKRYCQLTNTEPRYRKMLATFFGPDEHFKLAWTVSKVAEHTKPSNFISAPVIEQPKQPINVTTEDSEKIKKEFEKMKGLKL